MPMTPFIGRADLVAHHREELALGEARLGGLFGQRACLRGRLREFVIGPDQPCRHRLGNRFGAGAGVAHREAQESDQQRAQETGAEHDRREDVGVTQAERGSRPELEVPALPFDVEDRASRQRSLSPT